jgi:hypothetical protein
MDLFFDGGFLSAVLMVVAVVAGFSLLPVIPFLVKKKYRQANFYFWLIDIPITIALTGPMLAILFDEAYAQVGWVFYFGLFPISVLYYLGMVVYVVVKLAKPKD